MLRFDATAYLMNFAYGRKLLSGLLVKPMRMVLGTNGPNP